MKGPKVCMCRLGYTHPGRGGHTDPECPLNEPNVVVLRDPELDPPIKAHRPILKEAEDE